ncbi:hypothetical protein HY994_06225 [Candidatus Micrarchaeota archaeon]|nr:hypothetical protein [Candidatus Micrarchaeota archaeon]
MTNGTQGQNTVIYAALAVILLIVIASSFYMFSQLNSLSAKVTELSGQNNNQNAQAINALSARIAALESRFNELKVTGNVILFYDSSCTFCNNKFMLDNLDQTRTILANQSIGLKTVDVKDDPRAALAVGVSNVPVFFAGAADLSANPKLVNFMNALSRISFNLQESPNGITAYPPVTAKVVANLSCAVPGKVQLEEFYSPTCPFCLPVSYGNGTRYNNASIDPRFASLSHDAAQNLSQILGAKISLKQQCINVHSLTDNEQVLNVSASDEGLCVNQVGTDAFDKASAAADTYGVAGAPTFVLDCQYITKVRDTTQLEAAICQLHPELCKDLPAPKLPQEILDQLASSANKTANATTNASG